MYHYFTQQNQTLTSLFGTDFVTPFDHPLSLQTISLLDLVSRGVQPPFRYEFPELLRLMTRRSFSRRGIPPMTRETFTFYTYALDNWLKYRCLACYRLLHWANRNLGIITQFASYRGSCDDCDEGFFNPPTHDAPLHHFVAGSLSGNTLFHDGICTAPGFSARGVDLKALAKAGDVESNPGPVPNEEYLTPLTRHNCSRAGINRARLGYRLRSDPELRAQWYERQMAQIERKFHSRKVGSAPKVELAKEALETIVEFTMDTPGIAQIFGAPLENLFGLNAVTKSVDRAVDIANEHTNQIRNDIYGVFDRIPKLISDALETQAGFLPITIRTLVTCIITLVGLYTVHKLIHISADFFSILYTMVKGIFPSFSYVFSVFDLWVAFKVFNGIKNYAQVGEEAPSVESFVSNWIPQIVPVMLSMTVAGCLSKVPCRDNSPDAWLRRMDVLPRACKGFSEINRFISMWFERGLAYAKELVYGVDPLDSKHGLPDVTRWMDEVVEASKELSTICRTRSGCEKVKQLWYRGDRLLKDYRQHLDRDAIDNIKRMLQLAARMKDTAINTYGRPKGVRAVPQLVWLVGESQIGKSTMQYFLAAELLAEFGMAKDIEDQMYMRAVEQEYADGYNGQYVWVIDDAFQMKDSSNNPNIEFFAIIRAVGNFPYALHMADISQKANTYFDSKSLICSTNNANLDIQSLTYPDAVFNRFAFAYEVRVKPEYQKIKVMHGQDVVTLDKAKAIRDAPIINGKKMPFNLNVYEFVRFDPCNMDRIDEPAPVSFYEMARTLRQDLRQRDTQSTELSAMLRTYATRLDNGQTGDGNGPEAQIEGDIYLEARSTGKPVFWDFNWNVYPVLKDKTEVEEEEILAKTYGDRTLTELLGLWQKVRDEATEKGDSEMVSESIIATSELSNLPYKDSTKLSEIDWKEHVISTQRQLARPLTTNKTKTERALESTFTFFKEMGALIRTRWTKYQDGLKELWNRILNPSFESLMEYFTAFLNNPFIIVGGVTAICYGVYKLTTYFASRKGESESDTRNLQPRVRDHIRTAAKVAYKSSRSRAEMAEDTSQQMMIESIRGNQFAVVAVCKDTSGHEEERYYGIATVVKGSIAMIPHHFITAMRDIHKATSIRLIRPDLVEGIQIPVEAFLSDIVWQEEHDIAFVSLKRWMPQRRDITKYFASHEKSSRLNGKFKATLSGYRRSPKGNLDNIMMKGTVQPVDEAHYILGDQLITTRDVYEYDIDTQKGDCGMILTVVDSRTPEKAIGMHVAGSANGRNWSIAVWREMIEAALEEFDAVAQMEGSYSHLDPVPVPIRGEFLPVGALPDGPGEIAKSNIVPSSLHGKLTKPITKPAKLRPFTNAEGLTLDPLVIGVEKGGKALPMIDQKNLRIAIDDCFEELAYNHRDRKIDMRILTYEEAVAGVETEELIRGISRVTSPGYPYTKTLKRGKGKTMWMGHDDYEFDTEDALKLRADVDDLELRAATGGRMDVLWIDTLKDERRPIDKVDAGKTRIFSNGPMHFNILFRKYFQTAFTHIQHNRIYNGSGVGINCWSAEWEALYRMLTKFGKDNVFDGDISGLDVSLKDDILWGVMEILDRLYDDGNTNIREALWMNVTYASRYFRKSVYQVLHNVPSGLPGTTIVDTIGLKLAFRLAWLSLAPAELRTMKAFREHVYIIIYGDDNVVAVSDIAKEFYNMETITSAFAKIGLVYTDAAKTGVMKKTMNISEIQFLKRRFLYSKYLCRHTCPADLESRLETLNWTKNNNVIDSRLIESDCVQNVLQEIAAFSDKELFDEWAKRILTAAREAELPNLVNEGFFHYHIPREERF